VHDEVAAEDGQTGDGAVHPDVARAGILVDDIGDDDPEIGAEVLLATAPETKTAAVRAERIDGGGDRVLAELFRRRERRRSRRMLGRPEP
jgi:hypothetical protein